MTDLLDRLRSTLGERYAIERQIGEGGMAIVYRAKDLKHERTVAIKVLRRSSPSRSAPTGSCARSGSPPTSSTPTSSACTTRARSDGLLYYVMPFIEGESLRDRLNKEQQLPIDDALQIVREARRRAAVRPRARDRPPRHQAREHPAQGGHALVADFGIARAVSQAGGEKLTQTGMAIGTPHYMSPEQSLGSEQWTRGATSTAWAACSTRC